MNPRANPPPFDPKARVRLCRLLGMLGSDHAGERDAAGRMAHNLVQSLGLSWLDIIIGGAGAKAPRTPKASRKPRAPAIKTLHDLCAFVIKSPFALVSEREFARDLQGSSANGDVSRRQVDTLKHIYRKIRSAREASR